MWRRQLGVRQRLRLGVRQRLRLGLRQRLRLGVRLELRLGLRLELRNRLRVGLRRMRSRLRQWLRQLRVRILTMRNPRLQNRIIRLGAIPVLCALALLVVYIVSSNKKPRGPVEAKRSPPVPSSKMPWEATPE